MKHGFCKNCGGTMNREVIDGAMVERMFHSLLGSYPEYPYSNYDENDGGRLYGFRYTCENKRWYNNCETYTSSYTIHDRDLDRYLKS